MRIVYTISRRIWNIAKWIWSAVVVIIVVSAATSLFAGQSSNFFNSPAVAVLYWFQRFGILQDLTLGVIGLYGILTLASGLILALIRKRYESKPTYAPPPEIKERIPMRIVYTISRRIWNIAKWVWSAFVVIIVASVPTSLFFSRPLGEFDGSLVFAVLYWFHTPGIPRDLTLGVIGLYIIIALASGLISALIRKRYAFDLSQKVQTRQRVFLSAAPADNSFPTSIITAERTIKDTVEKRQDIIKDATFIYGPVQGFVQGEHNTVTLIFQESKVHTMPFLAPPQPPYNLVGRDELIRELKQQLFHGGSLALSALNGLPGVGKTALALAIAHDREVLGHFCDGVLWAGLGRESNVFSYLGTWGMALGIPQSEMEKLTSFTMLTETLHRAIGTRRMLLVVDDAWSPKDALAFKLGGPYCAHIVTTRLPEVADRFASEGAITVRELDEDDSLRLLEQLAPGVSVKAPDEVREIIQAVGGLPLPLILMGNYVRIQMKTEQLRRLRTALDRLLQVKERLQLEQPQGGLERHPSLPEGIPLSQLAVIKISDEALDQETQQVLRSLSVFPSKPNTFSEEAALAVAATNTQAIDTLHDFGLLESSGPARYTLHQTISDYAQINLSNSTAYERMVAFFIEYVQAHKADRDLLERETNNILAAVEIMLERGMNPPGASAFAYFIRIVRRTRAI